MLLAGCSKQPELYIWGKSYESSLYSSLQNGDQNLSETINKMNETIIKADSEHKKLPPGFYAQLGLLYGKVGNYGLMRKYFEKEKQLFPESKKYMNFLLSKGKVNNKVQNRKKSS